MIVTIEKEDSDDVAETRMGNEILKAISGKFDFNTLRVDKKDVKIVHKIRVFVD